MKHWVRLILLLFLIDACVDPLPVSIPRQTPALVFDGLITNDPGPYEVKIFYTGSFDGFSLKTPTPEKKATVVIKSDANDSEQLLEIQPGVYRTSASGIQGQVGRSYWLEVKTNSGRQYRSEPQKLLPAGQIDRIYVEYDKMLTTSDFSPEEYTFSVYVDAHGDLSESNLFRWRYANTFKGKTFPELHQRNTPGGYVPDPLPCSGYVVDSRLPAGIRKVGDCTCCICWGTEYNSNSIVSENKFAKDQDFPGVLICKSPVTAMRFYEKYYIAIDQLSVSPEAYEFWKLVQALQQSTGSLFQPNSVKVRGNIKSVSFPDEPVYGIFSVSGISHKTFVIQHDQVTVPIPPLEQIMYDCHDAIINATTIKPPFW